ncbi:carbonic anhydrase family protein [Actinocrispum wychmicini]|uniref:carbonic anhydrase family protein n=1 Tax=Actinocrispum wychmicini TaxID=1213861 RepID=UPI0010453676
MSSYRYTGSLTTSPYSGNVQWILLRNSVSSSSDSVNAFQNRVPPNTREEQRIQGGTTVRRDF